MILVETPLGEFEIRDGEFTKGGNILRILYEMAIPSPFKVSDGPEDFAIAKRMTRYFKRDEIKILEQKHKQRRSGELD